MKLNCYCTLNNNNLHDRGRNASSADHNSTALPSPPPAPALLPVLQVSYYCRFALVPIHNSPEADPSRKSRRFELKKRRERVQY